MEELQAAHRKQQRDLQSRTAQKKKNATKKTRKGVDDECAALERAMAETQQAELDALGSHEDAQADSRPTQDADAASPPPASELNGALGEKQAVQAADLQQHSNEPAGRSKKPSRQKARLARRAADQEAAAAQAADEAANMPDQRQEEREAMDKELAARGLVEKEVRSDGHCLYAAVADQLQQAKLSLEQSDGSPDYKAVRRDAATLMEKHPDDYSPFLEEPLASYVSKVRDTAEWGGHLELSALARTYSVTIQVLQGSGRLETMACPGEPRAEIWLAYYRHSFGLGEHYNSLRRKP